MTDLHPDIVRAIQKMANTKLGRRYDRMTEKRYGVDGSILAGKTVAGEFGGRSTRTGRNVVSSAGARGPAQFISSTRDAYMKQYGVDPWKNDKQAIKGMMLHHLNTGVEGYNPGMPTYKSYIMGQKLNPQDRRALRNGSAPGGVPSLRGPQHTDVTLSQRTIPGQSFAGDRQAAKRELLLGGDISLKSLLRYKQTTNALQDVPARKVAGDLKVQRSRGPATRLGGPRQTGGPRLTTGGGVHEVFYDPLGRYYDSGKVVKGAIGGHGTHVHVSADPDLADELGYQAERMGLTVRENNTFDPVDRVHTDESYHYKNMAIDVSGGTEAKRRKFARLAMREARKRRK
jgi:hypothetical protein